MTTFPSLSPQTRTYIPGANPVTPIGVLTGDEFAVRHTNASVGHVLRLGFRGLTPAQHASIIGHYNIHGRFQPFDIPALLLTNSNLTFPANYQWIYASSPQTIYTPGVVDVSVELQLLPPYTI